jgi:hypothetical protein
MISLKGVRFWAGPCSAFVRCVFRLGSSIGFFRCVFRSLAARFERRFLFSFLRSFFLSTFFIMFLYIFISKFILFPFFLAFFSFSSSFYDLSFSKFPLSWFIFVGWESTNIFSLYFSLPFCSSFLEK